MINEVHTSMVQPVFEGSQFSWEIHDDTLFIHGDGDLVFAKKEDGIWDIPWYYLDFHYVKFMGKITSIAPETFHTSDLVEVDIPDSVKVIGALAFCKCQTLEKVNFGNGLEAIEEYAFADCTLLGEVALGPNVKTISYRAFENCSSMVKFVSSSLLKSIGEYAFCGCSSLAVFTVNESLEHIEGNPFSYCTNLTEFRIENNSCFSLDSNGNLLAEGGTLLKSVLCGKTKADICETVNTIGKDAFRGSNVEQIVLPKNVTKLENSVFRDCKKLVSVDISNLYGIPGETFSGCESLSKVKMDNCIRIGPKSFSCCYSLETIVLPNKLDTVEEGAFLNCINLKEIVFNPSLQSIGMYAFYGCSRLEKIDLPKELVDIGEEAFFGCDSLKKATLGMCLGDEEDYIPDTVEITYLDE